MTSAIALGWVDPHSPTAEWDSAQVRRLARQLGYRLQWVADRSLRALVEHAEAGAGDLVVLSSAGQVDALVMNRLLASVDVECAVPRESFARWSPVLGFGH